MKNVLAAAKLLLADATKLETPAVASAVAGVLAPIIAAVAGVDVTAAELAGDLVLFGGVAAVLQRLPAAKAANAKPAPVVPPVPPVKK